MATDRLRADVLVVGGGNAALCAAIAARRKGADVLVVEAAPRVFPRGNTPHTPHIPSAHEAATAPDAPAGGCEATIAWLQQGWGPPAQTFLLPGPPNNRRAVLKLLP
ncbi:MAG: FAD-binding protein, partial [Pararhizobium sp.]